jgi:hypothetical protein
LRSGHEVRTAAAVGWSGTENEERLRMAATSSSEGALHRLYPFCALAMVVSS